MTCSLFWLYCFVPLLFGYGFAASFLSTHDQPYRTAFHFQPPRNWMNDPNAPLIYKGVYHLFYQHNPKGVTWGNIVWAHSTSTDLVNWMPHSPIIHPSRPFDINGCWSGSATILATGRPAILYTGLDPRNRQVQNLAFPVNLSDPYLTEWAKIPHNPVIFPTLASHINETAFRDPSTAWMGPDKQWRVVVGSLRNQRGLALHFTSRDFMNWTQSKYPLHSVEGNGMWECPDFFPVSKNSTIGLDTSTPSGHNVKHVLKVSLDDTKKDYYTVGRYKIAKGKYVPDKGSVQNDSGLRYDYGKFYASKSFFDSEKKRRVMWGWVNESSTETDNKRKGWSGLQAIPRTIWLDKSRKQLIQWPIREIEKLRTKEVKLPSTVLKGGSVHEIIGVTAAQADVQVTFGISDFQKAQVLDPSWTDPQILCRKKGASVGGALGPFGLLVLASKGLQEYAAVFFRLFKAHNHKYNNKYLVLMCSDQSRSSLNIDKRLDKSTYGVFLNLDPRHETLALRSLIDHSIIESFGGGGKACITARVYPLLAVDADACIYAFNYGNESVQIRGNAWNLRTAKIN